MSNNAYQRVLSPLFITAILAAMIFASLPFVEARPITIEITPSHGPVGSIMMATGINAIPYSEVKLYFFGSLFFLSTISNRRGGYSANFSVPALPSGTYPMAAVDVESGDRATALFTIEPRISVTPMRGSYGDDVKIIGCGFASYSGVIFTFDGDDVTPFSAPYTDNVGSFESTFQVPSKANGTYVVTADDGSGNLASTEFVVTPEIVLQTPSGSPGTFTFLMGYGFAPSASYSAFFDSVDITMQPAFIISLDGSFSMPFFVPDVADGLHFLRVNDSEGNTANAPFVVPSPILKLIPDTVSGISIVTVKGDGFIPRSPVILYFDDLVTTSLLDMMWESPNLFPNKTGSFEYSFVVPVDEPGQYTVAAYQSLDSSAEGLKQIASSTLTIREESLLDVQVSVGSIHFNGEIAEFYIQTSLDGKLVNVLFNDATLYCLNGSLGENLISDIEQVSTGLYRISYGIPNDTQTGAYVLQVSAEYNTRLMTASGTNLGSFLISPTLAAQNALLTNIENDIGTIIIPDLGTIKANLTAINATLTDIKGRIVTIQSDVGTLQADADDINARLISLDGRVATVESDLGTLQTTADSIHARITSVEGQVETVSSDIGTLKTQTSSSALQNNTVTMILALIAAIAAIGSMLLILRRKPSQGKPTTPDEQPPTEDSPATIATPQEETREQSQPQPTEHTETKSQEQPITEPIDQVVLVIPPESPVQTEQPAQPPQEHETQQQQT